MRYRLNAPEVVTETLDGEALIVHLGTGAYYSCRGSGEAVWAQLLAGRTVAETSAALAASCAAPVDVVATDVERFVAEAIEEGLVVEAPAAPQVDAEAVSLISVDYAPPAFEKYTDMQELLALDPVHDVDAEQGWPRMPAAPERAV